MDAPTLITLREARQRLALSESALLREIRRGALSVVRVGRRSTRIDVADLAKYVAQRRETAPLSTTAA
jgi:excisionase family DNA binding protein